MTKIAPRFLKAAALAAVLAGAALPAFADRQDITVSFRYDAGASAETNYRAFLRKAERACLTSGLRPLAQVQMDQACMDDLIDRLVARMGRSELALVHLQRTGRAVVETRALAAR